jgi:hypothetical protein
MARPRVVDVEDGLQTWRVAANIKRKQPQRADKGWSSVFGVERGANNFPSQKKNSFLRSLTQGLRTGRAVVNTVMNIRLQ